MHPRMVPESLDLQFAEMGCAGLGTTSKEALNKKGSTELRRFPLDE